MDVQPGDRAELCGGMMEPSKLEGSSPDYHIVHVCKKCGFSRRNRVSGEDNAVSVIAIADRSAR